MSENLTLADKVIQFLEEAEGRKHTITQIAQAICRRGADEYKEKGEYLGSYEEWEKNIYRQVHSLISREKIKGINATTGEKTRKFWYSIKDYNEKKVNVGEGSNKSAKSVGSKDEKYLEKDLYEPLSEFLYSKGIYSKRIKETDNHSKSKKPFKNHWLYPDIVGIDAPKWDEKVMSCASKFTDGMPALWSFEVKKEITSDLREYFFQAVANSSWANFGYLVATEIKESNKESVMEELQMLSDFYGIGFIELDRKEPKNSKILISATKRSSVDWNFVNRLATINNDFLHYVDSVERICKGERFNQQDWEYDKKWDKQ